MKRMLMVVLVLLASMSHAQEAPRGDVYQASIPRGEDRLMPPEGFLALSALLAIPAVLSYDIAQKRREQMELARLDGRNREAISTKTRYKRSMMRAGIFAAGAVTCFVAGSVKLAIEDDRATFRYEKRF